MTTVQKNVAGVIVFVLFVHSSVSACVRASRTLLIRYLEKYWMNFLRIISNDVCLDRDERLRFWGSKDQSSRSR